MDEITKLGLLYEKLVVMPGQKIFPAYYMMVQRVIREMANDFPHNSSYDWGDKKYEEFYEKWLSQLVKKDED